MPVFAIIPAATAILVAVRSRIQVVETEMNNPNPNPFEEDNGGDLALDDVSLNMASTDDVTAGANEIYADEDVQRSLQQGGE